MCKESNFKFVCTKDFSQELFFKDGLHLNEKGCKKLGDIYVDAIRADNFSRKYRPPSTSKETDRVNIHQCIMDHKYDYVHTSPPSPEVTSRLQYAPQRKKPKRKVRKLELVNVAALPSPKKKREKNIKTHSVKTNSHTVNSEKLSSNHISFRYFFHLIFALFFLSFCHTYVNCENSVIVMKVSISVFFQLCHCFHMMIFLPLN